MGVFGQVNEPVSSSPPSLDFDSSTEPSVGATVSRAAHFWDMYLTRTGYRLAVVVPQTELHSERTLRESEEL